MAIVCPVDLDTLKLRAEIQSIYARVAADPSGDLMGCPLRLQNGHGNRNTF